MFFRELKIIFQITLWKINKFWQIQQTEMLKVNTTKLKTKICSTERRKACANNRTQKKTKWEAEGIEEVASEVEPTKYERIFEQGYES